MTHMEPSPTPSLSKPSPAPQPWWRPKMPSIQKPERCAQMWSLPSSRWRCIFIVSLLSIIFICLVATIIWLSFLPRHMKYLIEQGSVADYRLANDTLNANFHILLQANNPNSGFEIYYNGVTVSVSYEGAALIDNSTVPSFHQPSRNITHVGFILVVKDVRISGTVARDLHAEWDTGDVALDFKLGSKIVLKFGSFKIHRGLKVHCKGLKVPFSSSKGFEKVACRKHVYD